MSDCEMPPNYAGAASKKNKKKERSAVLQPVQPVPPQPQQPPSRDLIVADPVFPVNCLSPEEKSGQESDAHLENKSPIIIESTSSPVPIAPPRSRGGSNSSIASASVSHQTPPWAMPDSSSVVLSGQERGKERIKTVKYNKGQVVRSTPVLQSSVASSVVDFVHEAIPSQQPNTGLAQEKIEWAQFHSIDRSTDRCKKLDVLLLGLARGFQIWTKDGSEFEEVVSEMQGPIRSFIFLDRVMETDNEICVMNPFIALVDAFSHVPDKQFCTVSLVALGGKKVIRLPSAQGAFDEPVLQLLASKKHLVVCLSSLLVIYDISTLKQKGSVRVSVPPEGCATVCSLYNEMLAYAEEKGSQILGIDDYWACLLSMLYAKCNYVKLKQDKQSCWGVDLVKNDTPSTYANQVYSVAKFVQNAVASVSGSSSKTKDVPKGVVSVIDIAAFSNKESCSTIAHFVAHMEPLGYCAWSPDGRLLLTADSFGTTFHVFSILPHPVAPSLGSVQHLYRLHRGSTSARVVGSAFSTDCRWLAIATNHGTIHVFAVSPYGGKPTTRTHGDQFTNKESRYLRSSGLMESSDNIPRINKTRMMSGAIQINKEHPCLLNRHLARSSGNPRIGPYPSPILLTATKKIRDPKISSDNLTEWAGDLNPVALPSKKGRSLLLPRVALTFTQMVPGRPSTLLVARAETGVVFEYELRPKVSGPVRNSDDFPSLDIIPASMWTLQRTKHNADIPPPLQDGSPLRANALPDRVSMRFEDCENWIPQVEMCTYSGPARRLWLGPQFSFYAYNEEPELMSPSESRQSLSSMKSIPIVMGDKVENDDIPGDTTRIECGSYVSQSSISFTPAPEDDVSLKIAEAMKESLMHDSPRSSNSNLNFQDGQSQSGAEEDLVTFDDIL